MCKRRVRLESRSELRSDKGQSHWFRGTRWLMQAGDGVSSGMLHDSTVTWVLHLDLHLHLQPDGRGFPRDIGACSDSFN